MGKLLAGLRDPTRSGVYRVAQADEILDATLGGELDVVRIDLTDASDKDHLLAQIASALAFPRWFGHNWDALEDCLSDLSWRRGEGHVLIVEGFEDMHARRRDEFGVLLDIFTSSAQYWQQRDRPFFVAFVDRAARLALPDLFRARSK